MFSTFVSEKSVVILSFLSFILPGALVDDSDNFALIVHLATTQEDIVPICEESLQLKEKGKN